MALRVEYIDLGEMSYSTCWEYQQRLFEAMKTRKLQGIESELAGTIIMVEHPAVYTLGKSGKADNMLISKSAIEAMGAEYYHIDRGGDITFHGTGQIVCYPILDLEMLGISLKEYIGALEQAAITTAAHYGVATERLEGAAGVWIAEQGTTIRRKICAIGVKSSRYITMHGMAFNVNTDLSYFEKINPCGMADKRATSLAELLDREVSMEETKELLLNNLSKIINVKIYKK